MQTLRDLVARLADRDANRTEATTQADVRSLLLAAPFHLSESDIEDVTLESPLGDRRRIDVETGTTVIEVKRNLRRTGVLAEAIAQLTGYVERREALMQRRYVGVLTDGAEWRCYYLTESGLREASSITLRKENLEIDELLYWLEGVLATAQQIRPIPTEIATRLGAGSSAHSLDQASLGTLYAQSKDTPGVRIKRQLWARLLTTALGSQFEDSDELFVEHTLLVNSAEIIAHAVLGLEVESISPASLLSGAKFAEHGIHGVVEPDFFDWVVDTPRGDVFVRTLARRLARFDWRAVEHDVLKVLYESVIPSNTRKKLGEYYTPDWLAERMVEVTISNPLEDRVLDPSCGSGTFLFHAVRRYLAAAQAAGRGIAEALNGLSSHVVGMDLHPVAVTLARVTYVLAIGPERLAEPTREAIQIPVYLGDSMQWQQKGLELWTAGYLVIQVDRDLNLLSHELRFPEALLEDSRRFDELVEEMARKAASRKPGAPVPPLRAAFQRLAIPAAYQEAIEETFRSMCRLHDEGRNHIWGYYVRNLARPVWLARLPNRVDVLIGNPPWLAFRHMTREMQKKFREMSETRGLWHGAKVATHQDLSGLFLVRVVQLYLKTGGRVAFVMPNAVLDRNQFAGFRTGEYSGGGEILRMEFETAWDLRRLRPHFFPRGSAVIFARKASDRGKPLPSEVESFRGRLDVVATSWASVAGQLAHRLESVASIEGNVESAYRERFRQGASVVPRVLFVVEEVAAGPLGLKSGTIAIRSARSKNEKAPWKDLDSLEGVIESEFVYRLFLGEQVLPYRTLEPARAVIPWYQGTVLHRADPRLELFPGLARWWNRAEEVWETNRSSERLSLAEQLNYHAKLSAQYPLQPHRVVYTKSGMHLAAARLRDRRCVVDHSLYWATVASNEAEAFFLCAILNSAEITRRVRPLMSYGKDERHIDKYVWRLGIPEFDPHNSSHAELASLSAEVEGDVGRLSLDGNFSFVVRRRELRRYLQQHAGAQAIERIVTEMLK